MSGAVIHVDQTRGGGLGASQVAQAIGIAPESWGSPIELWEELTGRKPRRELESQAARWGQILEPVVRGVYVERHGLSVRIPDVSLYHERLPWLRATPDGIAIALEGGPLHLVQVKCPGLRMAQEWGPSERHEVPVYYLAQATVEMAVTGLDRCDFAVLLGGQDYFEVSVYRDHDLEGDILDAAAEFWECVETDTPPPIDATAAYGSYLGTLLAAKSKASVTASPDLELGIERWREIREALRSLESEERLIKNQIMAAAVEGKARRVSSVHGNIPIVEQSKARTDWEAMARELLRVSGCSESDIASEIERYTSRTSVTFVRAPSTWKE